MIPDRGKRARKEHVRIVRWDDDTYKLLAEYVHELRAKHPEQRLTALVNKAQKELLEPHWHRNITTIAQCRPIISFLRRIDEATREAAKTVAVLQAKIKETPTKQDILRDLTDEEILGYFGDRVLQLMSPAEIIERLGESLVNDMDTGSLIAYAMKRGFEELKLQQRIPSPQLPFGLPINEPAKATGHVNGHAHKPVMPRVVIVGARPEHATRIIEALRDRAEVICPNRDSNISKLNVGADWCIIWKDYCSPAIVNCAKGHFPKERVYMHHGGCARLIERVLSLTEKSSIHVDLTASAKVAK